MNRRNGAGPKLVGAAVVIVILIYGLYSHNDVQSKLRTAEEKTERLRQQYDSLSAQLQVVYEHKSRLEKSLQTEKTDHKKTRDDLIARKSEADAKFATQKQELMNRVSALNQEYKMLQSQHEDLQGEFTKLQESLNKLQEDHKQQLEQNNIEYRQMQQNKENDIAKLKDEIANLGRRFNDDMGKLRGQNQQLSNQLQIANQDLLVNNQQLQNEMRDKRFLEERLQNIRRENQLARQRQEANANQQLNQQNQQLNQNQFNQQLNGNNQNQVVNQQNQNWLDKNQQQSNQQLNDNGQNANRNNDGHQNQAGGFNVNHLLGKNFNNQNQLQFQNNALDGSNVQNVNNGVNREVNLQSNQNLGGDANQFGVDQFDQSKLSNNIAPVNDGVKDPVNMQIALPGQVKHPGYHEVKDVDPADKQHHEKEMAGLKADNGENLIENKGPIIMQQAAPNLAAKVGDNHLDQMQAGGAPNGLDFQAPQPDLREHMDTFRHDKLIRNHPEILGAGGINQPDPDDGGRIKAPVANANDHQIPLPVRDGQVGENEDDDEDDKYDDGNDDGHLNNPQGQVMPPNMARNDLVGGRGIENLQENQVPVPNNNDGNNLLAQGQPVADRHGDYDRAQPAVPQGDDNDGDYQEDEDEDNRGRLAAGRDFH